MEIFENEIITILHQDAVVYYVIKKLIDDPELHKEVLGFIDTVYKNIERENIEFKQIFDARKSEVGFSVNMLERLKELGVFLKERETFISTYCQATVVIVESAVIRGILSFLLVFYDNKKPVQFVSSEEEAKEWLSNY